MGSSCDWSREGYTFSDELSTAVTEVFVRMYNDGLIYRGPRIVNWCTRCSSTLSDDEVVYKEKTGKFYYIKYGPVTIGTARPETKFADKVIIVHPDDERYKDMAGKEVEVDWIDGKITAKFVADEAADPEMGSGAMTITPAHSFIDFDLAKKHGFDILQIIGTDGKMLAPAGEFEGMEVGECRDKLVEKMDKLGLIESIDENYAHNLSVCYRCDTAIEPLISDQWFLDVNKKLKHLDDKSLKERMVEVVKGGDIEIIPDRFNKTYFHWIENLRDWCVSRQIWWGHRIPVWYCDDCGRDKPIVQTETPSECSNCKNKALVQDDDTLDTWYSSGLWTFSALGWPDKTEDLEYFHPTSVLETGYDILFFWVARMILMSIYVFNEKPFDTVYLHGLVRDIQGRKMSKSLDNGIDPLDMIEKYGTDAVRLALVVGSTPGNDMRLSEDKIAGYRNFTNKVWNIARFVLMNVDVKEFKSDDIDESKLNKADKWILTSYNQLIDEVTNDLESYHLSNYGQKVYDFLWNEYASWYVEITKVHPNNDVLSHVFTGLLKLLHPYMPFVTEAIWGMLDQPEMLIESEWPTADDKFIFSDESQDFLKVKEVINTIRSLRSESNVDATKKIDATIYGYENTDILEEKLDVIKRLANLGELTISKSGDKVAKSLTAFVGDIEIYLPLEGMLDINEEKKRLTKELDNLENYLKTLEKKLSNKGFADNAPKEVLAAEKVKLKDAEAKVGKIKQQLKEL